jgi:hypothetical protein
MTSGCTTRSARIHGKDTRIEATLPGPQAQQRGGVSADPGWNDPTAGLPPAASALSVNTGETGVARLDIAGLRLEFQSRDAQPLHLLRTASAFPPGFAGVAELTPAVTVALTLGGALAYRPSSQALAMAELCGDEESLAGHLSAICRAAMSQALTHQGGALMHGAAAVLDGAAILLMAPSEGGKTTLSGLLGGAGIPILSDETIAVRPIEGKKEFNAFGTFFWSGPLLPTVAGGWPIRGVAFLEKGSLHATELPQSEALGRFLQEWHVAEDAQAIATALSLAARILEEAPARRLSFELTDQPDQIAQLLRSWVAT